MFTATARRFISAHVRLSAGFNHGALQGIDAKKEINKAKLLLVGKQKKKQKRLGEIGGLTPGQSQYPTRALRSFAITMKSRVVKRRLQVSHLQASCTYARSERSNDPHEVQAAFQVGCAILRFKDVNV